MTALDKAIYDKYNADVALKAALPGGLHADSAPQDTAFPFGVWLWLNNMNELTFNSEGDDASLQFSIFSKSQSVAEVDNAADKLKACFDEATLTITGYHSIRMMRVLERRIKDPEEAWHYFAEYRILTQKQ